MPFIRARELHPFPAVLGPEEQSKLIVQGDHGTLHQGVHPRHVALCSQSRPPELEHSHENTRWAVCGRALRVVNPSPYMIYLQARGSILVASSPEILCHVSEDRVVTNR